MHGRVEIIFDNETHKQFPFEIIRITERYITLKLDKFDFDDKWELARLIEWFPPRELSINVMSRFVHKEKRDRFYLAIYYSGFSYRKNLADLISDKNSLMIQFNYHCHYWKKAIPLGIKLKIILNDKGLAKLFKHLL